MWKSFRLKRMNILKKKRKKCWLQSVVSRCFCKKKDKSAILIKAAGYTVGMC